MAASEKITEKGRITLKARQIMFNEACRAQRVKLHPKSENLSEMVKDIVSKLEQEFDDLPSRMITSPILGTTWKNEALDTTLNEIPRIPIAGTETGITPGFGQYIYQTRDTIDPRKTLPKQLIKPDGTWQNSVDLRHSLRNANPALIRSKIIKANSGRYIDQF